MFATENAIGMIRRFKTEHIVHFEHPYGTTDFQLSLLILLLQGANLHPLMLEILNS